MRSVQQLLANLRTTSERAQSLQVNLYGEDVLHVDTRVMEAMSAARNDGR